MILPSSGFSVVRGVFTKSQCREMRDILAQESGYKIRDVLRKYPALVKYLSDSEIPKLCKDSYAVRSILFRKPQESNWSVPWHQDVLIQVDKEKSCAGFGPWSNKEGVVHVQPPVEVMQEIMACRIHLSRCDACDGPLRVIPGSHLDGYVPFAGITQVEGRKCESIECNEGDVLLFSPLLLHASSPVTSTSDRAVLHLELAGLDLEPYGLNWANRVSLV